ncbi:MAG: DsbA family protein [Acidobacteria bacterium]|nr:DsbA family protein [Acidobacteriota bacterium]
MESYIRHLFVWGPQITVEVGDFTPSPVPGLLQTTVRASFSLASEEQVFYVSADGKHIVRGPAYPAEDNPFRADLNKITTALQPSFGTPGAAVVIATYSDFQCPHCREEAKVLRENILKAYPKEVRVYFKDMPLANHDWAKTAAIASRCIFRQNPLAFWEFHDWIFEKQPEITAANFREKLAGFIKSQEIDPLQLNRCLDKRETEGEVNQSIAEARSLGINATPTMFINGRRISGATPWPNLKQIIDEEIEYQKTAKNAGEDCNCEVRLPTPFAKQ